MPADIGRHGFRRAQSSRDRPYDSTRSKVRFDYPLTPFSAAAFITTALSRFFEIACPVVTFFPGPVTAFEFPGLVRAADTGFGSV